MKTKTLSIVATAFAVLLISGCGQSGGEASSAQTESMPGMRSPPQTADKPAEHVAQGTVNSVDTAAGTVNISHGAVASANWPAMTMNFTLADRRAAATLKAGDRVDFRFTIEGGMSATVTQIAPAP